MQALAGIADSLDEQLFHVHVDIFCVKLKLHLARSNVRHDFFKAGDNPVCIFPGDDALRAEHGCMRNGTVDVLLIQALIKGDGGVEIVDKSVSFLFKTSAPKFHE